MLSVEGRGHYAGTVMSVIQTAAGWFGEGDDLIYVDGERTAGIQGTGTEDYFNDARSLREAQGLYTGVPVAEGTDAGARMTAYRRHLADPIPFTRSFRFDFEHAGWTYNPDGTVRSAFEEWPDLVLQRGLLVSGWNREGPARTALWPGAPAPRQCAADGGRGRDRGCARRKRQSRSAEGRVGRASSTS